MIKELDNLCIRYLVNELKPLLVGSYINKIQEVEKGVFKFKLHTKEGSKNLIVTSKCFYFTSYSFKAPMKPHGYSLFLRKRLENERILDVRQHKWERIVIFETKNYLLLLELFANGNIILLDKELNILMPFKKEIWKDREIKKETKYSFPKTTKLDPPFKVEDIKKASEGKNTFRELLAKLNVAPLYLEEALKESKNDISKLVKILNSMYDPKEEKKFVCLVEHRNANKLSPIRLKNFKVVAEFESLNSALDEIFSKEILQKEKILEAEKKDRRLKELKFNLEKIKLKAKELEQQISELKKSAEWLYLHYAEVQEMLRIVRNCIKKGLKEEEILEELKKAGIKLKVKINTKGKEIEVEVM